ncbi:MAG: GAF domain-containing protein [Xanthobacteraceae bacterium]
MSDRDPALGVTGGADAQPLRTSNFRLVVEFAVLFVVALLLKQFLVDGSGTPYPNPLWLPVIVLSLEHGLAAGLASALIATALQFSGGFPAWHLGDDMYTHIGRVAAEPVAWACVSLLIGHIRSQQIAEVARLQADLAQSNAHCVRVADLCADLRDRTEVLERHIAANALSSNVDVAEAMREMNDSTWDDFAERLTRFVVLLTGTAEFSVYLLRDDVLKVVFQPNDEHTAAGDVTVAAPDPLFTAVVSERRTLSARRPADRAILRDRGSLAGPLMDAHAPNRVIGMFAIAGNALDDQPEDIERRFSLTLSEIARVLDRIILIEHWHAAAAPGEANGHRAPAAATPSHAGDLRPPPASDRPGEMTLQ